MKKRLLNVLLLFIAFILGAFVNSSLVRAQAQSSPRLQTSDLGSIPRAWGDLRGASDKYLVFEDTSGTIRLAFIESGVHNFVQIERQ